MPDSPTLADALRDPRGGPVCVGFSGGLDSTVLLHLLANDAGVRDRGLRALHVHHGLHPDADRWARHCASACRALDVPLATVRVAVAAGDGPEAAARTARHAVFADALGEGEAMALAHHRDDQAETFLLRALRGSGPDGLAAMRTWRRCGRGWLWRPLLAVPRARLLDHARTHGLAWIEDPSNADTSLDRNYLRARVLPLLRERWPGADASLARSAALAGASADLLDAEDDAALAAVATGDPAVLSRPALAALPPGRRARVLRRWIAGLGMPPLPAEGVERIESDLMHARDDASACFAWHGVAVHAWRDALHAVPRGGALPAGWSARWDGTGPLALPTGGTLRIEPPRAFDAPLAVRGRRGGERITLPGRVHSHALKHALQDAGIPPWLRAAMPLLLAADGTVAAAGDRLVSGPFADWLRARGARLAWSP